MLVPLYRLQGHGDHFYTTSATERDNAVSQYGYEYEGIACYVSAEATPAAPVVELLTPRDQIALACLHTIIELNFKRTGRSLERTTPDAASCAELAYRYADALMAQRSK